MRAAQMVDDPVVHGFMHSFLGRARLAEGRHADGLRLLSEGLKLQTGQSDTRALAIAYKDLALGHLELRQFQEAIDLFQTSAALFEEMGEFRLVACLINNVADAYNFLGEPEVARTHLRRVMALLREHPHPRDEACALSTLGEAYLREGDPEALHYLERALALHRQFGDRRLEAVTLTIIAQVLRLRGEYARALACLDQAMRIHQSFANRHDESQALQRMADVHLARDDHEEARQCLLRAVAIRRQLPYPYLELGIHRSLAEIAATTGRSAEEKYHRAQVRRLTPLVPGKPVAV
jgi:tetratricopeptide (TPR) repeat protein